MDSIFTGLVTLKSLVQFGAATGYTCTKGYFFGLVPWDYYLPYNVNDPTKSDLDATTCSIKHFHLLSNGSQPSDVPLVLIAVVDDLLRIAGVVAVAFVFVGAFRYVASQGNPEDTARAQSTIVNALIGVALASIAVGIVSFLGHSLGK